MQYTDNDKFLMPWGKYQGKMTIAEMVKKDPDYANWAIKPDEAKDRIIQELKMPTLAPSTTDDPGPGDNRPF